MKHVVPSLTSILALGIFAVGAGNPSFAQMACDEVRLTASEPGGPFNGFGYAVAVSGKTAVIGACCFFQLPTYVFSLDPGSATWIETQMLLPSDLEPGEDTGRALAIDGDVALVAAGHVHEDDAGLFYGAVFVFRYNGSLWVEEDELLASDSAFQDGFGASVSISGDVAVIGAVLDDDSGSNSGSAYVFRFDPKTSRWIEEQKLLASDGAAGDFFGTSVAASGDLVVVGADGHDDACPPDARNCESGAAYVFRFDPASSQWVEEQKLLASDAATFHRLGGSVSVSGETVLIGARMDGAGSAYVFRFDPGGAPGSPWVQEQKLVASDPTGADQFGRAVAIDGDTAVIGAFASDAGGLESGAAYIFRFDAKSSQWVEQRQLLPEPNPWLNFFGWSVALQGNTVVIGAHGEDQQAGSAYVYDLPACLCPADLDGDGTVGILDLLALLAAWGPNPGHPADFNGDGAVGILDLLELLSNWGPCP